MKIGLRSEKTHLTTKNFFSFRSLFTLNDLIKLEEEPICVQFKSIDIDYLKQLYLIVLFSPFNLRLYNQMLMKF